MKRLVRSVSVSVGKIRSKRSNPLLRSTSQGANDDDGFNVSVVMTMTTTMMIMMAVLEEGEQHNR